MGCKVLQGASFLPSKMSCVAPLDFALFKKPLNTFGIAAGSVEAVSTLAPGVLRRVRQCACACENCDALAQRLNEKLQLGNRSTSIFLACELLERWNFFLDSLRRQSFSRERPSDASRLLLFQSSQLWDVFEPKSVDVLILDLELSSSVNAKKLLLTLALGI